MLTGRWTAVLVLAVATTLTSCVNRNDQRAPDVMATVGDAQVTVAEVRARLPAEDTGPVVVRPGVEPPDTWRAALNLAIRDELLSLDAVRRNPSATWAADPAGRAARIRSVVEQERARNSELQTSAITDSEASSWFERNHERFDVIESAHVTWALFTDSDRARTVLDLEVESDQARFVEVARDHGATTGTAVLDSSGRGADVLVARVAFALRKADSVGMVPGLDGSGWLVRVDRIHVATPPWTDELADRVRTAMAWEREQRHLDSLAEQLRSRWPVTIDEQRFAASRPHEN